MWRRVAQSLATLALLLLCPAVAHAQAKTRVYDFCSIGGQKVITQGLTQSSPPAVMGSYGTAPISSPCVVTVFETGTLTLATIFQDAGGTPQTNPFSSANTQSYWYFYGTPGDRVDVTISGGGLPAPFTFADILIGGAVPTALLLQTNGVTNLSQTSLNFVAGSNITLTNTAAGNVRVDATGGGAPTLLQTNGVTNSNQSLLNLQQGAGITLGNAAGVTTISASGVTSLSGDATVECNMNSTGNVTLSLCTAPPNFFIAGPESNGTSNLVQQASTTVNTNGAPVVLAYPNPTKAGDLLVVVVTSDANRNITDTLGTSWTTSFVAFGGASLSISYNCSSLGGADTVTVTGGATFYAHLQLYEFTGNATSSCLDQTNTAQQSGGTSFSLSTAGGVAQPSELILGIFNGNTGGLATTLFNGSGSTQLQQNISNATVTPSITLTAVQNATTSLTGIQTMTAAADQVPTDWVGSIMAFELNTTGSAPLNARPMVCQDLPLHTPCPVTNTLPVGLSGTPEIVVTPGHVKFNAPLTMDPSYIDFVGGSAPANPSSGTCRFYFNSGTTLMAGLNSSGGSCLPLGPLLQTNGTNNGSQAKLNLAAGSNITLTDNGTGTITIAGTGGGGGTTPGGASNTVQFNSAGAFGGVTLNATATKEYLQQVSSGAPTFAQVAAVDISGLAASATTDTTNASNISSGTLGAARLPTPTASTLGGIESFVAVTHQWINAISTSGVPSATRPAAADLSDTATAGNYLRGNGTSFVSAAIQAADVPALNQNTTGTAANLSGTPALPNGTTATTQSTADTTTKLATDAFVHNNLPAFQVNGTPTGSQSLVNLAAGSNITITDGGSGTITIASTGGGGGATPGGSNNAVQYNALSTFGGTALNATATKEYLSQTSSGTPVFAQVAAADISGLAASATTDTTNASNISSGTLAHSLLPPLVSGDIPNNAANTSGTAANLSGTPTLPNGTAATTQAASDNSTKLATTAYVTTGIANAIAGVNPAVAVQAATAAVLPNSPTYSNGVSGIGATLTAGALNVTLVVDGYTPALADRVLVQNQASAFQNGVYSVTQLAGVGLAWVLTRALDYDQPSDMNNTGAIPVVNGTVNASTSWVLTSKVTTVGTDPLTFTQFTLSPTTIVTQTLNATNGQVCTYTGANKVCVPSAALPNGVTATTQSPLDSSTKVATTAYTDAAITASNVMTGPGDRIGGGTAGAQTRVAAGLTGQVDTATNGSTGGFASPGVAGRTVSTSTGDTILGDSGTSLRDRGTTILYTSTSPETVTLGQAGSSGFNSNFVFSIFPTGAGAQTLTPTTSTINGQSTLVPTQNTWCSISSPDNTNYIGRCANWIKAGAGLTATFNADTSTTLALATALPNGTTATKQALGDNTGDVASDSFVHDATRAVHMYMTGDGAGAGQSMGFGKPDSLYAYNYIVLTTAITVTRIGVSAQAPAGCSTVPQFGIYDNGTPNTSSVVTLANSATSADSGAISINVAAGHAFQLGVVRAESGCSAAAQYPVETVEYIQQ